MISRWIRLFIVFAVLAAPLSSALCSDLCSFKPSAGAQRIVDMRNIFSVLRLFADTSTSHNPPLVPATNERSYEPISGLESIEDTVNLKLLVHPSGAVLEGKAKKPGHQLMSDCLAYQWAAEVKFVPASNWAGACASWKVLNVFVRYTKDSVRVHAISESLGTAEDEVYVPATLDDPTRRVPYDGLPWMEHYESPEYPEKAGKDGREGTVIIRNFIDTDGSVHGAYVLESSGHADLDAAALESASKNRWYPATFRGKRIPLWCNYSCRFEIRRRE